MERTLALDAVNKVGKEVKIAGWVRTRRDHGKIVFLDVYDRSGIIQVVLSQGVNITHLGSVQDAVTVTGKVQKRPENLINKNIPTGEIEVAGRDIEVLSKAAALPFDMGGVDLNLELPTLLDYRPLTLRHPKQQAIFKIQKTIAQTFRKTLKEEGFTEIFVPTIVPTTTEGGAEVFKIDYYKHKAYLAQSPQLYKQIMVGVFERVFTIAHAYRAEPSVTTRHLSEYVSLDAELGFIDSWEELMDMAEKVVISIIRIIEQQNKQELDLFNGVKLPQIKKPILRIKLREAQEILLKRTKVDNRAAPDLDPSEERELCRWAQEETGAPLVFVTHFPTKKRPFYTMPDPKSTDYTLSFDLLGMISEWVTGGQRINDYQMLLENTKKWGNKPENFELYLQAFKYGMPPEGGFAMGLERITKDLLGLSNVREASLFPRDMERVDGRMGSS